MAKNLIDSIGLGRLDNGSHYTYHLNTLERAKSNETISAACAKVLTPYDAAFQIEDKELKVSQKSLLTDEIVKYDEQRNTTYTGYVQIVKQMINMPIPDVAAAAKVLNQHIKDYRIDPQSQMDKKTGLLKNFTADLEEKFATEVQTLNLTPIVEEIVKANDKVNELIQQRAVEYASRTVGATKQARANVDEAYRDLIIVINANIIMDGDEDFVTFAKHQNEEIKRIKLQVLGQNAGGTKPDGEDSGSDQPAHEIKSLYMKEGANPDKPLEFKRNKTAVMEGKGLKLIDSPEGKKAKVVLIDYLEQRMPHEDSAILLNSDEKIDFTMMYDAAEGKYNIQVETYSNGTEEAVVIKFPETITLV